MIRGLRATGSAVRRAPLLGDTDWTPVINTGIEVTGKVATSAIEYADRKAQANAARKRKKRKKSAATETETETAATTPPATAPTTAATSPWLMFVGGLFLAGAAWWALSNNPNAARGSARAAA